MIGCMATRCVSTLVKARAMTFCIQSCPAGHDERKRSLQRRTKCMLCTARSGQPGRAPFCSRVYKLAGITLASVGGAGDDPAVAIATD